ncbi:MAG: 16S rRNA (uracil(1498)-N(3))-methyltransferase, partial [Actinomycetota bacterium]
SVVRWSNVEKQLQKLRVVAREAAMQSRRTWLPTVSGLVSLAIADCDALAVAHAQDAAEMMTIVVLELRIVELVVEHVRDRVAQ